MGFLGKIFSPKERSHKKASKSAGAKSYKPKTPKGAPKVTITHKPSGAKSFIHHRSTKKGNKTTTYSYGD